MKTNNFQRVLIAALVLIALSPFACGFGTDDNSDEDVFPVGIYIYYGAPKKIAYLKNGKLTKFDAPADMRSIDSLRGLGFDSEDALAYCLNKIILIKPTGEKKILISGNIELINVTKYGLIYFDFESETLNIADYEGNRTEITEAESSDNIITSVSPDGRKILCCLDGKGKFLIADGKGREEFDADIDKNEAVGVSYIFNNGSFVFTAVSEEKTSFYYADSDGTKEIISFEGEASEPEAYFNKQGNEALILINDALFKVNNRGEAAFISEAAKNGKFGGSGFDLLPYGFVRLIPSGIKSGTLCLNNTYIYDSYQLNNFYYRIRNEHSEQDVFYVKNEKPYFTVRDYGYSLKIYDDKILYEDKQGNLCIDKYENGKLKQILKIDNIQGSYDLNQTLERGYIYNDFYTLDLCYFNEGEVNLVQENILINYCAYGADGRCAAIRATDSEGADNFIFYKDGRISGVIGDDKVKYIICTVYDEANETDYIGDDEVYYVDGFDRLMKWTPENGNEILLRKVWFYAMVPEIFPKIEYMNDYID